MKGSSRSSSHCLLLIVADVVKCGFVVLSGAQTIDQCVPSSSVTIMC